MQALAKDPAFEKRAAAFVLLRFDTRNGNAPGTKELLVTRNNAYVLAIDAQGGEVRRLLDQRGEGSWSGRVGVVAGREPMKSVDVLSAMDDVTHKRRVGMRGTELLLRMLRDERAEIREDGLWHIRGLGRMAAAAVPALIEFLVAPKGTTRRTQAEAAARALAGIGPAAKEALPYLERAALAGQPGAAYALSKIDQDGKRVVPTLIRVLESPRLSPYGAARGVRWLGAKATSAVPALMGALERAPGRHEALACVLALTAIGPGAKAAIPLLERIAARKPPAGKDYQPVEASAAQALARIRRSAK